MKVTQFVLVGLLAAAGCNSQPSSPVDQTLMANDSLTTGNDVTAVDPISTPPPPSPPPHRYDFNEGGTYGYISDVSEEDQKKGKATGDVVMFTYQGSEGGIYRLTQVAADGLPLGRYECSTPCVAIKRFQGETLERIAYSPDSIIGAAYQDAMNGYLEPPKAPPRSGWAGTYHGTFEGNATGTVSIKDQASRLVISIGVGSPSCAGSLDFTVARPTGSVLTKSLEPDDSGNACTMKLTKSGRSISLEEDSCMYYHGAECDFVGTVTK